MRDLRACGPFIGLFLCGVPSAQSVDLTPAYHPSGPAAGYAEVIEGDLLTVELSLPGLTHAQSQAQTSQWVAALAASPALLPSPLPIAPGALWYLDPTLLLLQIAAPKLEFTSAMPLPAGFPKLDFYAQTLCVRLSDLKLFSSPALHARVLPKEAPFPDEMAPVGRLAAGSTNVFFDAPSAQYHLRWQGPSDAVEYVLDLNNPSFSRGGLRVLDKESGLQVLQGGGAFYSQGFGQVLWSPPQFESNAVHVLEGHGLQGAGAWFQWRDEAPKLGGGTSVHRRRHEFTLVGRSLKVHVRSLDPKSSAADNYYAFRLGNLAPAQGQPAPSFASKRIAYMDQIGITLVNGQRFHSAFVDLFHSNAAQHSPAQFTQIGAACGNTELMIYTRQSDDSAMPLDETGWVTLSPRIDDVFVETTAPPSPRAQQLAERVGITFSREPEFGASWNQDHGKIDQLLGFGFDDVYLFKFHWMHYGTNRRATTHWPPNPLGGSEASFTSMIKAATNAGWRAAVYTDMFSLDQAQGFDDNPNYHEGPSNYLNFEDGLKKNDLGYRPGFSLAVDPSVPQPSYYFTRILAPRRARKHWDREADHFVDIYGSNAAYFDIVCITAPDLIITAGGDNIGGALSQDVRSPSDATLRGAIQSYKHLFQHAGERSGGATVGEGSFTGFDARFDTFYAGYLDGTYRTLSTGGPPAAPATSGQVQPVVVDYELTRVRGKHYGFGLGQPQRFFPSGGYSLPLSDADLAEYRATSISYAHNGYVLSNALTTDGGEYLTIAQQVKEYYTFRALQHEWNKGVVTSVRYRAAPAGSPWMDLSQAIKTGLDLVHPVIDVQWSHGLRTIVNHGLQSVQELGQTIPTHGWYATNPGAGYENIAITNPQNGKLVHRVLAPNYMMADGNGSAYACGGAIGSTTDLTVMRFDTGLTLIEQPDGTILEL